MRKFKRRRRRAGFVALMSLVIVVLGVALFFRMDPFQRTSVALAERVAVPMTSEAPQAVSEQAGEEQAAAAKVSQSDAAKGGNEKREAVAGASRSGARNQGPLDDDPQARSLR